MIFEFRRIQDYKLLLLTYQIKWSGPALGRKVPTAVHVVGFPTELFIAWLWSESLSLTQTY